MHFSLLKPSVKTCRFPYIIQLVLCSQNPRDPFDATKSSNHEGCAYLQYHRSVVKKFFRSVSCPGVRICVTHKPMPKSVLERKGL